MKCEKCARAVTTHITEVVADDQYQESHLCDECAQKYLDAVHPKKPAAEEEPAAGAKSCPNCGLTFAAFRNGGRLGCPHDYDVFAEELTPLLENVHGDTRHRGKTPRRLPQLRSARQELGRLRQQLDRAVTDEKYEEAARLRDRIRQLDEG